MRLAIAIVSVMLASIPASADALQDSQLLYNEMTTAMERITPAISAPVSRDLAKTLEVDVYNVLSAAERTWSSASFANASGDYNRYWDFKPCESAAQLLRYVTQELIQHHRGIDVPAGMERYRHFNPFLAQYELCNTQIEALRAETAAGGN